MSLPRLLAGVRPEVHVSHAEHVRLHGPAQSPGPRLADLAEAAGLRGRGGAGFPTAVKLRAVRERRGPRTVLVNGAEGEPMSAKDRLLMRLAPHLVLDGALAAADAVDAGTVVLALPEDAAGARLSLERALAERRERRVALRTVPAAHLAGEERALIQFLNGGPLLPTTAPPLPAERGLRRRPTLVQNPETLAHLALIARHGSEWFRAIGPAAQPGSALLTVSGAVRRPGVQEVACGTPLAQVLERSGGALERVRAVLVGGYHGAWLPGDAVDTARLDDVHLGRHGATLAAGVVVVLGTSSCGVRETARVLGWLAAESAGQCGPCANGLPALADLAARVADGRAPQRPVEQLERWAGQVAGRGACRLPDGAIRFLRSSLQVFAAEFAEHAERGPCRACLRPGTMRLPRPRRLAA